MNELPGAVVDRRVFHFDDKATTLTGNNRTFGLEEPDPDL